MCIAILANVHHLIFFPFAKPTFNRSSKLGSADFGTFLRSTLTGAGPLACSWASLACFASTLAANAAESFKFLDKGFPSCLIH